MEYNVTDDIIWMLFAIFLKLHLVQHASLRETLLRGGGGGRWRMRQNGGMFSSYLTDVQTSLLLTFILVCHMDAHSYDTLYSMYTKLLIRASALPEGSELRRHAGIQLSVTFAYYISKPV